MLDLERHTDSRGFFARTFCASELSGLGLDARVAQASLSSNARAGTLRGMHYAAAPSKESKLVRCTSGRIFDVILDLRRGTPTFGRWVSQELSRKNGAALFIPPGVAHGFLTLEDESDILYQMTEPYDASVASGVRFDDAAFGIEWPGAPAVISERDRSYPDHAG